MKITVLLADYAKADQQGKITAVGLGWKTCPTPVPPHAIVIYLDIGWDETNQPHKLTADLLTADGIGVAVSGPVGVQPVHIEAEVEAGRPPGAIHGSEARLALAVGLPTEMPLPPGRYEWRVAIDGFPDATAVESFLVEQRSPRPGPVQQGPPQGGQ